MNNQTNELVTIRLQLIELFGLLGYKRKQIDERVIMALDIRKETREMTATEVKQVMQVTLKYVTDGEYNRLLARLTDGASKIEKMDPKSDKLREAIKLYNRIEKLVLQLRLYRPGR